mmetsp:Transcript_11726/g.22576  ORF Transcript_11726/g.22576 Transcript_11726/m.22576 type:complete len:210 (-) Transcript_11726:249-878(-)
MSRVKSIVSRVKRKANRVHAQIPRAWHLLNADKKVVGHVARVAATILQGKHKPMYNRARDVGDHVVIVNAENVELKGSKWKKKIYRHHTGYPGGLKEYPASLLRDTAPEKILIRAVRGMLPKSRLRPKQLDRLRVYPGDLHPHERQIMQIPEDEMHADEDSAGIRIEILDTFWDKFPNKESLVYKDEPPPEDMRVYQTREDEEEVEPKN